MARSGSNGMPPGALFCIGTSRKPPAVTLRDKSLGKSALQLNMQVPGTMPYGQELSEPEGKADVMFRELRFVTPPIPGRAAGTRRGNVVDGKTGGGLA